MRRASTAGAQVREDACCYLWLQKHLKRYGHSLSTLALGDLQHLGAASTAST